MKQKDIAVIIIIAFVSGIASFIISGKLFVTPTNRQQQVEVVPAINADFTPPSDKYFSKSSIDPTQLVQIGSYNNQNPFGSRQ